MNSDYTYLALLTGAFVLLAAVGFWASERERKRASHEHSSGPNAGRSLTP